ncbi:MAG: hypothetical protein OEU54_06780 [Gemmatimonadota bacterium]|nr:hypothetical protein [Gemmatimonadota bacterium]
MSLLRRLRGVVGTAATWAVGWGILGGVLHALAGVLGLSGILGATLAADVIGHALIGLFGGGAFSALLLTERVGSLDSLSVGRSTAWGALAGLAGSGFVLALFPGLGLFAAVVPVLAAGSVVGGVSGGGMSAIARSASRTALGPADEDRLLET